MGQNCNFFSFSSLNPKPEIRALNGFGLWYTFVFVIFHVLITTFEKRALGLQNQP